MKTKTAEQNCIIWEQITFIEARYLITT